MGIQPNTNNAEVKKSPIDGKGLFATIRLSRRRKIGELTGELISQREAKRRAKHLKRIVIVELNNGMAIDGGKNGNDFQYINHSCSPNTFIRRFRNTVEVYALRDIKPGEELTCDYGESYHDGTRPCTCGSPTCRGCL